MKKFIYLLIASVAIAFVACNDDKEDTASEWAKANEEAYAERKAAPPLWQPIVSPSYTGPTGVYRRVIKEGPKGTEHPIQTAEVKIHYRGWFYNGTEFDPGTSLSGIPRSFRVNEVVRGFGVALQNMVVGDKWEICIPWFLGYGASNSGSIRGYSTLFFEIELLEINQYP